MTPNGGADCCRASREANWIVAGPKGAATRLGIKRSTLQSRMQKLGIHAPAEGAPKRERSEFPQLPADCWPENTGRLVSGNLPDCHPSFRKKNPAST